MEQAFFSRCGIQNIYRQLLCHSKALTGGGGEGGGNLGQHWEGFHCEALVKGQ